MSTSRDAILSKLAKSLQRKRVNSITWPDVVKGAGAMTAQERTAFLTALSQRQDGKAGLILITKIRAQVAAQAQIDVATMFTDDTLSLEELQTIIGD